MFRIIVRRNYVSESGEYESGDYLKDKKGDPLKFDSGTAAIEYIKTNEGESIYNDGVLDWWKDVRVE